ncbi:PorT family protein [Chitinophaga silvatica]|uniref:PorT family protein n=1 Tax=Chitinophaga silvatica TaxID=2282649 RepID=A0A3E1YGB2_9BACT|nr:porin family protein [Chitinophaga silvatica]RFS26406.1 PorT family protein [Chitinophaga silvatica]
MKIQNSFKWLLPAFLAFCGLKADAQQIDLGARGGISIPNLSSGGSDNNPLNTGYKSRLGPEFGIFGEYHVSKLFSIEAMINFSGQGGKKSGLQAVPVPADKAAALPPGTLYLYNDIKSEAKFNYLMVPILAKFGWDLGHSPLRLYVDAGPFVGFLLNAKQVISGTSATYLDPAGTVLIAPAMKLDQTVDIKDQLHKVNVGVAANVGLAYQFGRNNIFIEGGGNYGFLNIQKGTANGKNNIGAGTVVLGYAYRIKK